MAFKAGAIYGEASLNTTKWTSSLGRMTKGASVAAAAIAAAFTAAFASSVKAANEFQKAMSNVSTLVDTSVVNMQALTKQVLQLNPALGDATEITKGLYQAFSAGAVDAQDAMKITTDAATFAKAALTDTFTAVDALTTAVNAYGRETMTTTKASDIFFQTIKYGKITGEELAATIGTSIPLFANTGIRLEELAAGMAAMTKQGINAHLATTQLNAIINMFLKPSNEMVDVLNRMGYESGAAMLKAEGLAGALDLVQTATGGDAAEMAKLLPNVRALRGAMALSGVGGEEFTRVLEEMENAAGVTGEAFNKQEKTFETLRNTMKNLQITVGNIGKHFVDKLAVGATQAAQGMLAFIMSSQGMELVANIAGGVAGAFELIKGIVEPLFAVVKDAITTVWDQLKVSLAEVFGETTGGAGAMKLLAGVVNIVSSAVTVMGKVIASSIEILADWIIAIKESAGTVGTFFKFLAGKAEWSEVQERARNAGDAFKTLGKDYVDNVAEIYKTVWDEMKTFTADTEDLSTELTGKVSVAFSNVNEYVKANWGELLTGQEDFIGQMLEGMAQLGTGLGVQTDEDTDLMGETWLDFFDRLREEGLKTYQELQSILDNALNQNLVSERDYARLSREIWEENWNSRLEKAQTAFDAMHALYSESFGALYSLRTQYYTNVSAETELWYQSELARLESQLNANIITEEQFQAQKDELDRRAKEKRNAIAEAQFKAEKANKIVGVISNAASSIMGWWAQAPKLGPIAGPIFAGAMTALTTGVSIAQIALISQQKFVPEMATGGTASGITRINERGGEILNLPDGTVVIPNDISQQIAQASASAPSIYVSFDGARISNEMDLDRVTDNVIRKLGKQLRLVG